MTARASNSLRRRVYISMVLLAMAAGLVIWLRARARQQATTTTATRDRYATVQRGDFNIALELDGNLDAIEHHRIRPENQSKRFGLEIVELVEDHSQVKTGDLLFRFSDEKYAVEQDRLQLALEDEQTSLQLALEDLGMTKAGNLSNIRTAYDQLRASQESLARYEEEDARRKRSKLQTAIRTSRVTLGDARSELSDARANRADAQMQEPDKVDEFERLVANKTQAVEAARDAVAAASGNLRVFKQYDHPQKMRSLEGACTKAEMALQRDLVNAAGNLVKDQRRIQNHRTRIRKLETDLAQLKTIRQSLALYAPADGIVTFGNPQRRSWNQPEEFKVGTSIHEGQIIATIPDLSRFLVRIDLPEEFRSRITMGLRAVLRSKAIPELVMEGKISQIAAMAKNVVHWDRTSPKIYPIEIATDTMDPRLMPGMTMRVEIIVEAVTNVLHVPIEALYQREGATYARVKGLASIEERPVSTGRSSNSYVEILAGLEEGEQVTLYQPGMAE